MRILISAYACQPGCGSEQGVGWNRARQLARFHEVWVLTRRKNRAAIEAAMAREPMPNLHFLYHDLPRWAGFWKKQRRGIHLYYYLWQLTAYFVGRRLHRQVGLDQVHHVTFVNYWMPSFLALLPVPFVWGPVGGGETCPASFRPRLSWRGRVFEALRTTVQRLGERDPFVRLMARQAAMGLATTPDTAKRLLGLGCRTVRVYSEAGLPPADIRQLGALRPAPAAPFRLVSIGNLLHLKGFEFGLRAFARLGAAFPQSEYWLMGEGPERQRLEAVAAELGIAERVRFLGRIPRAEVLDRLAVCDVLVHPSLHDSGGWVCLEAMAAGRPVICLDIGGPGVQVTAATGVKVPADSPERAVAAMADAMVLLAGDPDLRARMGQAGRQRVHRDFDWDRKGEWLAELVSGIARSRGLPEEIGKLG